MTRLAYRLLLSLYPPSFRRRFAAEMLEIFDTIAVAGAPAAVVASTLMDAMWSVTRQWILREKLWVTAGAICGQGCTPRRSVWHVRLAGLA